MTFLKKTENFFLQNVFSFKECPIFADHIKVKNPKNYYGYDERHNLEDTVDNHAYYESVHYKKKNSNLAIDKAI